MPTFCWGYLKINHRLSAKTSPWLPNTHHALFCFWMSRKLQMSAKCFNLWLAFEFASSYQLPWINDQGWYLNAKGVFWFWYCLGFVSLDTADEGIQNKIFMLLKAVKLPRLFYKFCMFLTCEREVHITAVLFKLWNW